MRQRCPIDLPDRRTPNRPALRALASIAVALTAVALGVQPAAAGVVQRQSIDSWQSYAVGGADVVVSVDTTSPHSGDGALRIEHLTSRASNSFAGVVNPVPAVASTSYTVTGWVKADGVLGDDANRILLADDWSIAEFLAGGTYDWTPFEWTFTTPADATRIIFMLIGQDQGTLWLDDLSVVRTGTSENLLANGDFETWSDRVSVANEQMVFAPGQAVVDLDASSATVDWSVTDHNGAQVADGEQSVVDGRASIDLTDLGPGYYDLALRGGTHSMTTSLAVIEDLGTPVASSLFGTSAHPDYNAAVDVVDPLTVIGAGSVRFDLRWEQIEPTAGQYTFTGVVDYDTLVSRLTALGIRPLVVLGFANPLYDNNERPYSAEGRAAYAAYAGAVAQHFGTSVDYEIYNEYNHPSGYHLGTCTTTVACYTAMLEPAAAAIRAAAPGAVITTTGVAGTSSWWGGGIATQWVSEFLATPQSSLVDVMSIHNYDLPAAPEGHNEDVVTEVRGLLDESGHADLPLWLTETGWTTPTSVAGMNTEAQQAQYIARDAVLSVAAGADRYMQYDLFDDWAQDSTEGRFGLFRNTTDNSALTPKPAAVTYAVLARQIGDRAYTGRDDLGDGVYSLRFGSGADTVRVMWALQPTAVTVTSGSGSVDLVGAYGERSAITTSGAGAQIQLGEDTVYLSRGTSTHVEAAGQVFRAVVPSQSLQGKPVQATVTVDLTDASAGDGDYQFSDDAGHAAVVTAAAGRASSATLTLSTFTAVGTKTIPLTVRHDGAVVGRLSVTTEVVENPGVTVRPAASPTAESPLELVVVYRDAQGVTIDSVDYSVGSVTGHLDPLTPVSPDGETVVALPAAGLSTWTAYSYQVTVSLSDGVERTVSGRTSFSPVVADGTDDPPAIDLATAGRWVVLGGTDGGAPDHSGTVTLTHDGTDLVLRATIVDDVQHPGPDAANMWQGDSIQVAFSAQAPEGATTSDSLGFALLASGPVAYRYGGSGADVSTSDVDVSRDDAAGTTTYVVRIPRAVAGIADDATRFSFSLVVNDADDSGREGYLEWGGGIGDLAGPSHYLPVYVVAAPQVRVVLGAVQVSAGDSLSVEVLDATGSQVAIGIASDYQQLAVADVVGHVARATVTIPADIAPGTHEIQVRRGTTVLGSASVLVVAATEPTSPAGGTTGGNLAATGGPNLWAALGVATALLIAGAAGVAVARRRNSHGAM
jgi:hypothetical protein